MSDTREQIEQGIAALEAQRAVLGDAVVDASIAALQEKLAELGEKAHGADQQRKQVTILFADISGFTRMSEDMDAEEVTELINTFWQRLDAIVLEHGGYIDKHMGDAVMALWGVEAAREDDPTRAIRAALAMQQEIRCLHEEEPITQAVSVRIGIHTGPVMLGTIGIRDEFTAVGDTVNTTSRLEHAAPVGEILISYDTYRHVRGLFEVQALGPITIRGKSEPMQAYVVKRAKPRAFHMGSRGLEDIETHLIGRQTELSQLQNYHTRVVQQGKAQVVLLTGEAGIGKSRLLFEYERWMELLPEQILYFKGRIGPERRKLPYALLRNIFSFRFQIQDSDTAETARQKFEQGIVDFLGDRPESHMQAHFIGQWIGFNFLDSPYLQGVRADYKQIHDRAQQYLLRFFKQISNGQPTTILLDDLHWADERSLEILTQLGTNLRDRPLLIVGLARPSLFERPDWAADKLEAAQIELEALTPEASQELVNEILRNIPDIPPQLIEIIIANAEGNPYYIEELIKMLIEDGAIVKAAPNWNVDISRLKAVRIPPTLIGILQSRLDSLPPPERAVLQRASVIGRTFWDQAVFHLFREGYQPEDTDTIYPRLNAVRQRELVFPRQSTAFSGATEYIFKNTVLREVTYESVLRRDRREFHSRIANWLIDKGRARINEFAGLIAHHLTQAERADEAIEYLQQAGQQAAAQFANQEAITYLSQALDLLPEDQIEKRLELLYAREKILDLQGTRAAQKTDIEALQTLAQKIGTPETQARVFLRKAAYEEAVGNYPAVIAAIESAIQLDGKDQPDILAAAQIRWGTALWRQGSYEEASAKLEQALPLVQPNTQEQCDCLRQLGIVSFYLGNYPRSETYFQQALHIAREIDDRRAEVSSMMGLGNVTNYQSRYADAHQYYDQALALSKEIGDRRGEGLTLNNIGTILIYQDRHAEAREYFRQSLEIAREIGDQWNIGNGLHNIAITSAHIGEYLEARSSYEQALEIWRASNDRRGESNTLQALGNIARLLGNLNQAQANFQEALEIARETGERQKETLILNGLSSLLNQRGQTQAALELAQKSLAISQDINIRHLEADALLSLAEAYVQLEDWEKAQIHYQKACQIRQEIKQPPKILEAQAGLAQVLWAQGQRQEAQKLSDQIVDGFNQLPREYTEDFMNTYLVCYALLQSMEDERSQRVLETAYFVLTEHAAKIPNTEARQAFLTKPLIHQEILSAYQIE